jgi:hypothetical protein
MDLTFSPTIIFIIISGIIVLLIAILATIDHQLRKGKALQKQSIEYRYTKRFIDLKKLRLESGALVNGVDRLARDFMQERFGIDGKMDYSQLMETLKVKGKPYAISFCQKMLEVLYSGERASSNEAHSVLTGLELMLKQEGVLTVVNENDEFENEALAAAKGDNFITQFVRNMSAKIDIWNTARKNRVAAKENTPDKREEKKVETANLGDTKDESKFAFAPIPKKEYIVPTVKPEKYSEQPQVEKKYYENIASVDVLDRIKNKVKNRKDSALTE